jgi:TolA-binding protein
VDKIKFTRKDLKRPDEFVLFTTRAYHWVISHQMEIFYGLIALLIIVVGAVFGQGYFSKKEAQAANLLYEADSEAKTARNKLGEEDKTSFEASLKKALDSYDEVIKRYPSSKAAGEAYFAMGNLNFDADKYNEAAGSFRKAEAFFKSNERARGALMMNLGYALEAAKNYREACGTFAAAADLKLFPEKDLACFKAGECFLESGNKELGKRYLDRIVSENPESEIANKARELLSE